MLHISGKNARNLEKYNLSCICRTHLSREVRRLNLQNMGCACAVLFFCYISMTVAQLLFDFIKHDPSVGVNHCVF